LLKYNHKQKNITGGSFSLWSLHLTPINLLQFKYAFLSWEFETFLDVYELMLTRKRDLLYKMLAVEKREL